MQIFLQLILKDNESCKKNEDTPSVPSDVSNAAAYTEVLEQLRGMGFKDACSDGGWLYDLVKAKDGDLQKILDALHPGEVSSTAPQED